MKSVLILSLISLSAQQNFVWPVAPPGFAFRLIPDGMASSGAVAQSSKTLQGGSRTQADYYAANNHGSRYRMDAHMEQGPEQGPFWNQWHQRGGALQRAAYQLDRLNAFYNLFNDESDNQNQETMDAELEDKKIDSAFQSRNVERFQAKFFPFFSKNYFPFVKTTTTSVVSTSVSMVTTAIILSCILSDQFKDGSKASACNRKRRAVFHDADQHILAGQDQSVDHQAFISPTKVEPFVATILSNAESNQTPDIIPSMKPIDDDSISFNNRRGKAITLTATATITTTSYSFIPTTVTTTINLVPVGAPLTAKLTCIPVPYIICTTKSVDDADDTSTSINYKVAPTIVKSCRNRNYCKPTRPSQSEYAYWAPHASQMTVDDFQQWKLL